MTHSQLLAAVSSLWIASELVLILILRSARRTASSRDEGSLGMLWGTITLVIVAGSYLRGVSAARIAHRDAAFWTGIVLIVVGIGIRLTAILTLRRYFTVDVAIHADHELIDRGLYAFVRHPSYSGALLSFLGLGLAFGNWLSVAVIAAGTVAAFGRRIAIEERALTEQFGDRYRAYSARTRRLVPWVY